MAKEQTSTKKPQIMIRLSAGGDEEYQREWTDPSKGSVTNLGTYNSSYTAIRGGDPSGPHPDWFDLSPAQLAACEAIAEELGTSKVVVIRKVGSYRTAYIAQTYKFGANRRYYVCECEIGE